MRRSSAIAATIVFLITLIALCPSMVSLGQHGDERMYVWKAHYYGSRLVHLDFSTGDDKYLNPGWDLGSFWALEQPWGSHLIYAVAMGITRSPPPAEPFSWSDYWANGENPATAIPPSTILVVRFTAVLCAAIGLALIAYRLRWPAVPAVALFLLFPHVRSDLLRAWAEGPLLLGIGLCVATFGSRRFGFAVGLATSFKLTAIVFWPFLLWRKAVGSSQYGRPFALVGSIMAWIMSNPLSWFGGGILYLLILLYYRWHTFLYQSSQPDLETAFGLFIPTRYLWPLELGAILLTVILVEHLVKRKLTKIAGVEQRRLTLTPASIRPRRKGR